MSFQRISLSILVLLLALTTWSGCDLQRSAGPDAPDEIDRTKTFDAFTSRGRVVISPFAGDTEGDVLIELDLWGGVNGAAIIRRDAGPFKANRAIETEHAAMEIRGFSAELGEVIVRERTDVRSMGRIVDVEVTPDGDFVSGHASFDVFVEIVIPELGLVLNTGDVPIPISAGTITQLPPVGRGFEFDSQQSGGTIALLNATTGDYWGEIYEVEHTPEEECDCPDDSDTGEWNDDEDDKKKNNCYNYATNQKTGTFAQPGEASGNPISGPITCASVTAAAQADGARPVNGPDDCSEGECLIFLVVDPNGPYPDYHWYRQNDDGSWSHKPGQTDATNEDSDGDPITDPESAKKDRKTRSGQKYGEYLNCGYFCIPWDITVAKSVPAPLPVPANVVEATINFYEGSNLNPQWEFSGRNIDTLRNLINAGTPTTQSLEDRTLGYKGLELVKGDDVLNFPDEVIVLNGLFQTVTNDVVQTYVDTGGLEAWLVTEATNEGYGPYVQ